MPRLEGVGSEGVETREAIGASSHSVSKKAAFDGGLFHGCCPAMVIPYTAPVMARNCRRHQSMIGACVNLARGLRYLSAGAAPPACGQRCQCQ
jgi:hypothetical protein